MFFDMEKYVYSESAFNTRYTYVKKISLGQNKQIKNTLFFLSRAPTHHGFTFNFRFLYELKHKARLSKAVCGIFYF